MNDELRELFEKIGRYNAASTTHEICIVGEGAYGLVNEATGKLKYLGFASVDDAALFRHHIAIMWKPRNESPLYTMKWVIGLDYPAPSEPAEEKPKKKQAPPSYRIVALMTAVDPIALPRLAS